MSILELYLLTTLPNVALTITTISCVGSIASFVWFCSSFDKYTASSENAGAHRKNAKKFTVIFLAIFLMSALIPTKESMLIIAGGHYVSNIEGAQDVPVNTIKAFSKLLSDYAENKE